MFVVKNIDEKDFCNYECASIDTEWTKNYKIKNGNKPFNFSVIFFNKIDVKDIITEKLKFKFISFYIENEKEIPALINKLNTILNPANIKLLLGHQVISDLYTFVHYSETYIDVDTSNLAVWISYFKNRAINNRIFDTRFDIKNRLKNKSRRLVDVCFEMKIKNQNDLHKQPELNKSMTALQNEYSKTKDDSIREKLSVMNLRHNLSSVLVYELYIKQIELKDYININRILFLNLKPFFKYIETDSFKLLLNF